MKNIPGEKVTAAKKIIASQNGKIEFDKNIDAKDFKAISSHGSHRSHSSN